MRALALAMVGLALAAEGPVAADDAAAPLPALLAALPGGLPERVDFGAWGPAGPEPGSVSGDAFAAWLARTPLGAGGDAVPGPALLPCEAAFAPVQASLWCGPDAGSGVGREGLNCGDTWGWVFYEDRGQGPGAAFLAREVSGHFWSPCCGFFGGCHEYGLVQLTPLHPDVLPGLGGEGCYAAAWTLHPAGYCANSFTTTPLDTFAVDFRARGQGAALSFGVGTIRMDLWVGYGQAVVCYDMVLPREVHGGPACPITA